MLGKLVFGSRDWPDPQQIELDLIGTYMRHGAFALYSGGAEGTDLTAERWAERNKNLGLELHIVRIGDVGGWESHAGKKAAHVRNSLLAKLWASHDGPLEATAFHFANSAGTRMMLNIIDKARPDVRPEIYTEPDMRVMVSRTLDYLRKSSDGM